MRIPRRDENGFTLVEIVVAVAIEALILAALAAGVIVMMRGTTSVDQSLDRSADARIAAHYIISDARNTSGPEMALATSTCTDAHPPVTGTTTPIVEFKSTSTSSAGVETAHIVDYILVGNTLLRRECEGGSTVATSDRAVASNVGSVTAACAPAANCSGTPTSITVTVNEVADSAGHVYSFSLTGAFRKLGGAGAPPSPPSSVFLLGSGNCSSGATGLIVSGGSALRVYGTANINSGDIAGGSGCKAMSIGTDAGNYLAGSTQIFSGTSGGTCKASGSSTCPPITNYSPALADPYAHLPVPSAVPSGACTGSNPAPVGTAYPSGVYPQALNVPATASFSGTYIFCAGVSFTNGARVTGTNVLFYFKGGSMTVGGDARVALSSATSGSYNGLVVWQAAGDTTTMSIANGGQFTLDGAIYAPSAQVKFSGGSVTTSVTSIVAQTIYLSGGADVTLGAPSPTPLSISPAFLAAGIVNKAYTAAVTAAGGDGDYTWSATGLPSTLSMNADTGVISGTPTSAGTLSVTVTLTDALGDTPATKAYSLVVSPVPTITDVSLDNKKKATAGTIEAGDTVTVVFSSTMKVSSFCSTWSNDANDQTLSADNLVTVSVSNGTAGTNDALTVTTASGCTFNFGSINLGSTGYATVAATFAGSGSNKSTVAWDASAKTLVITLGAKTAGTLAPVASSTPIYTASGSIQDASGQTLGNSPFTLGAGKQF